MEYLKSEFQIVHSVQHPFIGVPPLHRGGLLGPAASAFQDCDCPRDLAAIHTQTKTLTNKTCKTITHVGIDIDIDIDIDLHIDIDIDIGIDLPRLFVLLAGGWVARFHCEPIVYSACWPAPCLSTFRFMIPRTWPSHAFGASCLSFGSNHARRVRLGSRGAGALVVCLSCRSGLFGRMGFRDGSTA